MSAQGYGKKSATEAAECRSCRRLILWVMWPASGKRMPVDVGPVQDGDIVLTYRKSENALLAAKASQLSPEALLGRKRFVSHFSTCPNATQRRRRTP